MDNVRTRTRKTVNGRRHRKQECLRGRPKVETRTAGLKRRENRPVGMLHLDPSGVHYQTAQAQAHGKTKACSTHARASREASSQHRRQRTISLAGLPPRCRGRISFVLQFHWLPPRHRVRAVARQTCRFAAVRAEAAASRASSCHPRSGGPAGRAGCPSQAAPFRAPREETPICACELARIPRCPPRPRMRLARGSRFVSAIGLRPRSGPTVGGTCVPPSPGVCASAGVLLAVVR